MLYFGMSYMVLITMVVTKNRLFFNQVQDLQSRLLDGKLWVQEHMLIEVNNALRMKVQILK